MTKREKTRNMTKRKKTRRNFQSAFLAPPRHTLHVHSGWVPGPGIQPRSPHPCIPPRPRSPYGHHHHHRYDDSSRKVSQYVRLPALDPKSLNLPRASVTHNCFRLTIATYNCCARIDKHRIQKLNDRLRTSPISCPVYVLFLAKSSDWESPRCFSLPRKSHPFSSRPRSRIIQDVPAPRVCHRSRQLPRKVQTRRLGRINEAPPREDSRARGRFRSRHRCRRCAVIRRRRRGTRK